MINYALKMLQSNPNIASNPRAQEYLQIIQNGDNVRGEQIANNLCNTYGTTKEEALQKALRFFNIR